MRFHMTLAAPRERLAWLVPAAAVVLAGCQSYRAAPLDLPRHRAEFGARLEPSEPLSAFVDRLSAQAGQPASRFDPADGLTLDEAEVVALFYNAELRLARLRAGVALATAEHAGRWSDPEFGFDGAEILSPEGPFEYGLTLGLTLPVSGRLSVEKSRARAAHEAELRRIVDAEWTTRTRVRSAWAAWSLAMERQRLIDRVVAGASDLHGIVERLASAGEMSRIEARVFQVELIGLRNTGLEAALETHRARLALLELMGLAPDADVALTPALPVAGAEAPDDPMRRLIEANTALAVRRAEYQTAEEALRLEVRKQYPDITIGGGYGNEGDDRLLLGFSLPVPIVNANRGGIAEAEAQRALARTAAHVEFEHLASRFESTRAELESVRSQRQAYEASLVPLLEAHDADLARLIDLGEVDTLLVLDSLRRGFEVRDRLLGLRLLECQAAVELTRLLGPAEPMSPAPALPSSDQENVQ
jgi:outer membrane protein TolC